MSTGRTRASRCSRRHARSGSSRAASSRSTPAGSSTASARSGSSSRPVRIEQPLVFPGNDLVGVMLPGGVRRLVNHWSLKPGERAVVIAADERAPLEAAETSDGGRGPMAEVVDLREPTACARSSASGSCGQVRGVELDGRPIDCDLLVVSGGRQPAYSLLSQAGARVEYDPSAGHLRPDRAAGERRGGRRRRGRGGSAVVPAATYNGAGSKGKCFVCICEDVTDKDVKRAIARGLRLDRAGEALHDGDDGPVPGQALPPPLDPALCARERDGRGGDRNDDRAAALGARRARPARRPPARARQADVDAPPPQGSGRDDDVDGRLAAARTPTATRATRPRPSTTRSA